MNHFTFTGAVGELRVGYHRAAELRAWTITKDRLTAEVCSSDEFWISQPPLLFVVPRPMADWTWPVTSLQIEGGSLTATLDLQES